jgi:trans-aconitate methyltransferase
MGISRCRVSYTDPKGLIHGIDVDAESLFEAVAIAVAQFREDDINPYTPEAQTEFIVAVYRNPVEHYIRLHQVEAWAKHTTTEGPAGVTKRERVRMLLGETG